MATAMTAAAAAYTCEDLRTTLQQLASAEIELSEDHKLDSFRRTMNQCARFVSRLRSMHQALAGASVCLRSHQINTWLWSYLTEIIHILSRIKPNLRSSAHDKTWLELQHSLEKILLPLTMYRKIIAAECNPFETLIVTGPVSDPSALRRLPAAVQHVREYNSGVKGFEFEDTEELKARVQQCLISLSQDVPAPVGVPASAPTPASGSSTSATATVATARNAKPKAPAPAKKGPGKKNTPSSAMKVAGLPNAANANQTATAMELMKTTDALEHILRYVNRALSAEKPEAGTDDKAVILQWQLGIERAIQVMGEYLKWSPGSPHLPKAAHDKLRDVHRIPIAAISSLRDGLSHANHALVARKSWLASALDSVHVRHLLYEALCEDLAFIAGKLRLFLFHDVYLPIVKDLIGSAEKQAMATRSATITDLEELHEFSASLPASAAFYRVRGWRAEHGGAFPVASTNSGSSCTYDGIFSYLKLLFPSNNSIDPKKFPFPAFTPRLLPRLLPDEHLLRQFLLSIFHGALSWSTLVKISETVPAGDSVDFERHKSQLSPEVVEYFDAFPVRKQDLSEDLELIHVILKQLVRWTEGFEVALLEEGDHGSGSEFAAATKAAIESLVTQIKYAYCRISAPAAPTSSSNIVGGRLLTRLHKHLEVFDQKCEVRNELLASVRECSSSSSITLLTVLYEKIRVQELKVECLRLASVGGDKSELESNLRPLLGLGLGATDKCPTNEVELNAWFKSRDTLGPYLKSQCGATKCEALSDSWKELFAADGPALANACKENLLPVWNERDLQALESALDEKLNQLSDLLLEDNAGAIAAFETGITESMRQAAMKKWSASAVTRSAVEVLLLQLSDILQSVGALLDFKGLDELITAIQQLRSSRSPLFERFLVRNYLAHGDPVLDSIDGTLAESIINNALGFIEKGRSLVKIASLLKKAEAEGAGGGGDAEFVPPDTPYASDIVEALRSLELKQQQNNPPDNVAKFRLGSRFGPDVINALLQQQLLDSIRRDDLTTFQFLMPLSLASQDKAQDKDWSFTHLAVLRDSPAIFSHLIQAGLAVPAPGLHNVTPFHVAAILPEPAGASYVAALLQCLSSATSSSSSALINRFATNSLLSALQLAAGAGHETTVRALLASAHIDPSAVDPFDQHCSDAPLKLAVQNNAFGITKALLARGASTVVAENGLAPIRIAVREGNLDLVRLLWQHGADVEHDDGVQSILVTAVRLGELEIAKFLIEEAHACTSYTRVPFRQSLLQMAVASHRCTATPSRGRTPTQEMVAYIGALVPDQEGYGLYGRSTTALHEAIETGSLELVRLVWEIIRPHLGTLSDLPALCRAVEAERMDMVEYLVGEGLSLATKDRRNDSAFVHACRTSLPTLEACLRLHFGEGVAGRAGVGEVGGISSLDEFKDGALMESAVRAGKADVVKFLHRAGTSLCTKRTLPLTVFAAQEGHVAVLEYFVDVAPNLLWETDFQGKTAAHHACEQKQLTVVKLFRDAVGEEAFRRWGSTEPLPMLCCIEHRSRPPLDVGRYLVAEGVVLRAAGGYSALRQAVWLDDPDLVRSVLADAHAPGASGPDFDVDVDRKGFSPIQVAAKDAKWGIVRILAEHAAAAHLDATAPDPQGKSLVERAIGVGNIVMMEYLAKKGSLALTPLDLFEIAVKHPSQDAVFEHLVQKLPAYFKAQALASHGPEPKLSERLLKIFGAACGANSVRCVRRLLAAPWFMPAIANDDAPTRAHLALLRLMFQNWADGLMPICMVLLQGARPPPTGPEICALVRTLLEHYSYGMLPVLKTLLEAEACVCLRERHTYCLLLEDVIQYRLWDLLAFMLQYDVQLPEPATIERLLSEAIAEFMTDDDATAKLVERGLEPRPGVDPYVNLETGQTLLHRASATGNTRTVEALISKGFDPTAPDWDGNDALVLAIEGGHTGTVAYLTSPNVNVDGFFDCTRPEGYLHCALKSCSKRRAEAKHADVAKYLLSAMDPSQRKRLCPAVAADGHSSADSFFLHVTARCSNTVVLQHVLDTSEPSASAWAVDARGGTALHHAARCWSLATAEWVLKKGTGNVSAYVNHADEDGNTALSHVLQVQKEDYSRQEDFVQLLHSYGADLNKACGHGSTQMPIGLAIEGWHADALEKLLACGADVMALSGGEYPLTLAARRRSRACLMVLLRAMSLEEIIAVAMAPDSVGQSALHYMAEFNNLAHFKYLLQEKAYNCKYATMATASLLDAQGRTPLHWAVVGTGNNGEESLELVSLLLEARPGADDARVPDADGHTPLQLAAEWRKPKTHALLKVKTPGVDVGANYEFNDPPPENGESESAHQMLVEAVNNGDQALVASLLDERPRRVDPNRIFHAHTRGSNTATTILHLATEAEDYELVEYLVKEVKVHVATEDGAGRYPACIAIMKDNLRLTQLLVTSGGYWHSTWERRPGPACRPWLFSSGYLSIGTMRHLRGEE